jgi:hypothetical protein
MPVKRMTKRMMPRINIAGFSIIFSISFRLRA